MTVAAEKAVCAWVNETSGLAGPGGAVPQGAFTIEQRSPAGGGAYVLVVRQQGPVQRMVAEGGDIDCATIIAQVKAGTRAAAEAAAAAFATAVQAFTGNPVQMGDSGVTCLVTDNVAGPVDLPPPPDQGELFLFQVSADFYLIRSN